MSSNQVLLECKKNPNIYQETKSIIPASGTVSKVRAGGIMGKTEVGSTAVILYMLLQVLRQNELQKSFFAKFNPRYIIVEICSFGLV